MLTISRREEPKRHQESKTRENRQSTSRKAREYLVKIRELPIIVHQALKAGVEKVYSRNGCKEYQM